MTVGPPTSFATAFVAGGAALGATTRWGIAAAMATDGRFPWPTLAVNVAGCLLLGLLVRAPRTVALALGIGFAGGLTTFSTLSLEMASMFRSGDAATAITYLSASLVLGVAAIVVGRRVAST